jgi:hypothetical protein
MTVMAAIAKDATGAKDADLAAIAKHQETTRPGMQKKLKLKPPMKETHHEHGYSTNAPAFPSPPQKLPLQ